MPAKGDQALRLPFQPIGSHTKVWQKRFYDTAFAPSKGEPIWDLFRLTPGRTLKRFHRNGTPIAMMGCLGSFHADPEIPGTPPGAAYGLCGYDAGHMCPCEAMQFDRDALAQTFYTSNVCPQRAGLNRGPWRSLEQKCFDRAKHGELVVVCGPVYVQEDCKLASGITIPDMFFKVVADPKAKSLAAWMMPNADHVEPTLAAHYVPLDKIVHMTKLGFPGFKDFRADPGLLDPRPSLKLAAPDCGNAIQIEDLLTGEYVLLRDYLFNPFDAAFPDVRLRIPLGFTTDFGSIPRAFTNIYPKIGTFRDPCFLGHDWLYGTAFYEWITTDPALLAAGVSYKQCQGAYSDRLECDTRLLQSLAGNGDNLITRTPIYAAVRACGGSAWDSKSELTIQSNRMLLTGDAQ